MTNGTSTSNKMVWHHTVAPGDVVVVDRNCHKSILHAIIMTGSIPVFLKPTRNHFGIIGPIPKEEFEQASIQRKIAANVLAIAGENGRKPAVIWVLSNAALATMFDRIVVFDRGRIVGDGDFDRLMAGNPVFQRLLS